MKTKIYISGKITGIENDAPALFNRAERECSSIGFIPVNPMRLNHTHDKTWRSYMKEDIKALCDCDAIYMLVNWDDSTGAKCELKIAQMLEMDVIFQKR